MRNKCANLIASCLVVLSVARAEPATLTNPARIGDQFQFTLNGDSNETYVIHVATNLYIPISTNLQYWRPILTNRQFAATRLITFSTSNQQSYYRAVVARPLFGYAIAAQRFVDLKGKNMAIDSFDSTDANYSTTGLYDPLKIRDHGDLAAGLGLTNSVNAGNASIKGKVWTGPGGRILIGPQGSVGSLAWHLAGNYGVQAGWWRSDFSFEFPNATAPYIAGLPPFPGGFWDGTSYEWTLGEGDFSIFGNLDLNNKVMAVTNHARLYVAGNVTISGLGGITIVPGASLKLYVAGPSASLGGYGFVNQSGNALNFSYYGLPSNTSITLQGNGTFIGTIYAPNAHLSLGGGGSEALEIIGAAVTRSIWLVGHVNFHYDEALARFGGVF